MAPTEDIALLKLFNLTSQTAHNIPGALQPASRPAAIYTYIWFHK